MLFEKNNYYKYNDMNNGYVEELINFDFKNLPDDEAPFMAIYTKS